MDNIQFILPFIKFLGASSLLILFYFIVFNKKASYIQSRIYLLSIPWLSLLFALVQIEVFESDSIVVSENIKTQHDLQLE